MPARGQGEREVVHERAALEALGQALRLEHDVAEPRTGRDVDLGGVDLAVAVGLGRHLLVARQTRLALGLPGLGVGPHPLQLALEHLGALGVLLPLDLEPLLLGLEVRRVVALVGVGLAAVELEDPLRDVVEEVPVVGHGQHGSRGTTRGGPPATARTRRRGGWSARRAAAGRAAGAAACTAPPGAARHRTGCRRARRAAGSAARPSPGRAGCRGPRRWRGRARSAGRRSPSSALVLVGVGLAHLHVGVLEPRHLGLESRRPPPRRSPGRSCPRSAAAPAGASRPSRRGRGSRRRCWRARARP